MLSIGRGVMVYNNIDVLVNLFLVLSIVRPGMQRAYTYSFISSFHVSRERFYLGPSMVCREGRNGEFIFCLWRNGEFIFAFLLS